MKLGSAFILLLSLAMPAFANVSRDAVLKPLLFPEKDAPKINTFEEFMPLLPAELLEQYVLMTKSGSRHKASRKFPRVITYMTGKDGYPILLAFSGYLGDPTAETKEDKEKDPLYNIAEIFAYNGEGREWETYGMEFSDHEGPKVGYTVSPKNPSTCYGCHGNTASTLHPRWEPYPFWKHAIGEKESLTPAEVQYLKDFVVSGENHPRYKQLKRQKNLELNQQEAIGGALTLLGLNTTIASVDFDRIQRLISKTPEYSRYKFAYLGAVLGCEDLSDFFPAKEKLGTKASWAQLRKDTAVTFSKLDPHHASLVKSMQSPITITTNLRFILDPLRVDYSDWNKSDQHPLLFDATQMDYIRLATRMTALDSELSQFTIPTEAFEGALATPGSERNSATARRAAKAFCGKLQKKSIQSI